MNTRQQYVKRPSQFVIVEQLDLKTDGVNYEKWGGTQTCKSGDWIVNNHEDTYTVDGDTLARAYRSTGPGTYVKSTPVWAEIARESGNVRTKEGTNQLPAGHGRRIRCLEGRVREYVRAIRINGQPKSIETRLLPGKNRRLTVAQAQFRD